MMVYMLVSQDKYELPLIVALSAAELARKCGVNKYTIIGQILRYEQGKIHRSRYVRVEIDEEEET